MAVEGVSFGHGKRSRTQQLPARVFIYLVLAGCLFAELPGYGPPLWHG